MADIFISYKSERRAAAEHFGEILADYGYTVWWDYGLISGRDFGAQIETELRAAKAVIVLWCSRSVESGWVREEAALAKRLGSYLPLRIEAGVDIPLGYANDQTLDVSGWDGAPQSHALDRVLREVERLVGSPPRPNLEGLNRTERAWRRFGGPSLAQFALIDALEKHAPPRTLPTTIGPEAPPSRQAAAGPGVSSPPPESGAVATAIGASAPGAGGRAERGRVQKRRSRTALLAAAGVLLASALALGGLFVRSQLQQPTPVTAEKSEPPPLTVLEPEMVQVPGGSFRMGSLPQEPGREHDEDSRAGAGGQRVRIAVQPFLVSRNEITFSQWDSCVAHGGCNGHRPNDEGWGRNDRPVINVSWNQAVTYVEWLRKVTNKPYRLLKEHEWEYAARGGGESAFWWGDSASHEHANYGYSGSDLVADGPQTAPVGTYASNPFGLNDMTGNVREWVEDCYRDSYAEDAVTDCGYRVIRGGSWSSTPATLRSAFRGRAKPNYPDRNLGFRVAL